MSFISYHISAANQHPYPPYDKCRYRIKDTEFECEIETEASWALAIIEAYKSKGYNTSDIARNLFISAKANCLGGYMQMKYFKTNTKHYINECVLRFRPEHKPIIDELDLLMDKMMLLC